MSRHVARWAGGGLLAVAVLAAGVLPAAAGHATAAVHAKKAAVTFGAKLNTHSQPSNAFGGRSCDPNPKPVPCTSVMTQAYRRPDPETDQVAPKNGTIGEIKIVAGVAGSFRLELAKANVKTQKAKIVARGPHIVYAGQGTGGQDNGPPYTVQTIKVNLPVKKGEFLAVQAKKISFEYCSGGGGAQLTFEPPLVLGAAARHTNDSTGCLMLLEAVYK